MKKLKKCWKNNEIKKKKNPILNIPNYILRVQTNVEEIKINEIKRKFDSVDSIFINNDIKGLAYKIITNYHIMQTNDKLDKEPIKQNEKKQ